MDKAIITECYVDTNLIETLVPTNIGYNKQHGCSNVAKLMKERLKDSFALGIVDKDKHDLDYLKEFDVLDDSVEDYHVLWKHKQRHHYVIQICPEVEPWLLKLTAELGINLGNHQIPNSLTELNKYAKAKTSKNDPNFRALFSEMKRTNHIAVKKLIHWVKELKEKNYKVDIKVLTENV